MGFLSLLFLPSGVDVDLRLFTVQQGNPFFNQAFDIV
jgi:hypothetical protein